MSMNLSPASSPSMILRNFIILSAALVVHFTALTQPAAENGPLPPAGFTSLFNGRDFTGWDGPMESFRIEDGAIVGGQLKQPIPRNQFLTTEKTYANFILRLKFRLIGENANAGIQIRSRRIPDHHEMIGYQADLGQRYWGALYDESRRRTILAQADLEKVLAVLNRNGWNEYVIEARGDRIRLSINGLQTVDYLEEDASLEQFGLIGLQIHSGSPSEAWYKDIWIRELP